MIHWWYPADPATPSGIARRRGGVWRRTAVGGNPALPELPLAASAPRFPVLIYYPGWSGTKIENTALLRNLASHGYVVAGVSYPLRCAALSTAAYHQLVRSLEEPMDYSSEAAYRRTVRIATERVSLRARDAVALVHELSRTDGLHARFFQRLDLERIGIVGFSLGGAVAAEASTLEARFRAVVNIDGRHWGRALEVGVRQPYLFVGEELQRPGAEDLASTDPDRRYNAILDDHDYSQLAKNLQRNGGIQVTVRGTEHMNFTDLPRRRRLRFFRGGRTSAKRTAEILNRYTLAFFQQVLGGTRSDLLLPDAAPFPEAQIAVWDR